MKKEIGNYSEIHQHYIKKGKTYSSSVQEALRFTLQDGKIHGNQLSHLAQIGQIGGIKWAYQRILRFEFQLYKLTLRDF